ncbi:DUF4148 domain-containing protein [Paraburkholderia sp. BCC1886]|uniref:DUF4148 domain-containing protein n=1 Tax=Paraburkholderia sp. BCC1886 TaxID=2562670 RepID=UPI001182A0F3|nr:DUF4148 domain-containing protein [Paraburkholderia sp. BCC1886]
MNSLIKAVAVALVLAAPVASFAQSNQTSQPVTRAEVRAQLAQLEKAGYNPAANNAEDYPQNIQAAEARVAAERDTTGVGGVANGSSSAGHRFHVSTAHTTTARSIYFGQ